MRVLGLETSGDVTGVAVVDERGVLAETCFRHEQQLSRYLAPRIQDVVRMAGLKLTELGGVAVSEGPGSFTGLRIGVTTAKSVAFAAGIPVVGISTLEAIAVEHPAPEGTHVWVMMSASKVDVFAALYEWVAGGVEARTEPLVVAATDLADRLRQSRETLVAPGPLGPHRELITSAAPGRLLMSTHPAPPRPATIAALGRERILRGEGDVVHAVAPHYLLLSAAEARRQGTPATP